MTIEPIRTFVKDPNVKVDYVIDWSDFLESADTIDASVWTVPSGLVGSDESLSDIATKIWLAGGTDGEFYDVSNKITTSDGRESERSIGIIVRNL